jgi:CDP-paratose 2-epimerase
MGKAMSMNDRNQSILICGGAGFIGSNWAHWLLENSDSKIHIFDNLSRRGVRTNIENLKKAAGKSNRLKITIGDVRDQAEVERAVNGATQIFQLAAQVAVTTSVVDPCLDFDVNLRGTFNIIEAARKSGNRPFVLFTSTNKVYGDLAEHKIVSFSRRHEFRDIAGISETQSLDFHSPYGCSKGAADQYVRDYSRIYDIPSVVFRMSCIAGPRQFGNEDQGWVAHFLYSALEGNPLVIYGDGRQIRDVLCVDDLVRAFDAARTQQSITRGQIYNVGGGPENTVSLLELIAEIEKITGKRLEHVKDTARPGDQLVYVTDYGKLKRDTGWKPKIGVRQTLLRIYDWWKLNRAIAEPSVTSSVEIALENASGAA